MQSIGMQEEVNQLGEEIALMDMAEAIKMLCQIYPGAVIFSTSFSMEDQVITDLIFQHSLPVKIFTLDTGRLFPETYSVWERTREKYNAQISAFYPKEIDLQVFVEEKGPNPFYESLDNRKQCCHIRKVEPLQRALKGNKIWITGLRAEHSASRNNLSNFESDNINNVIKYHPILDWSLEQIENYISVNDVPVSSLHAKGFVSIGCQPCTRAILPGEDIRAGRWWWEDANKKECGLHAR